MADMHCSNCKLDLSWADAPTGRCPECNRLLAEVAPIGPTLPMTTPGVVHDQRGAPAKVRVLFGGTDTAAAEIVVGPGRRVMLGRDPEYCYHAAYFEDFPGVSRRHAVVRVDDSGRAWIRDEYSTNLTQVDGEPLPPGSERELRDGDPLRFCDALVGRVEFVRGEGDDR